MEVNWLRDLPTRDACLAVGGHVNILPQISIFGHKLTPKNVKFNRAISNLKNLTETRDNRLRLKKNLLEDIIHVWNEVEEASADEDSAGKAG